MKQTIIANKLGLYSKLLVRLKEAEISISNTSRKSYIPFPIVFGKICRGYSITKQEAWEYLYLLRDCGFIDIVRFHGIKLNFEVKDGR